MAIDIKKWLTEEMGFTAEEAADLAPKFTPERSQKLEGGFLRQADYSRQMNELKTAQDDLTTANTRLNTELAEWATVQAEGGKVTKKMRDDLEKAEANALRLQQAVTRIATDNGLDPAKVLEGITVPVTSPPAAAAPDMTGYVRSADLDNAIGPVAQMALRMPAILAKIGREHHQLTGEYLDEQQIVDEVARRAGTRGNQKPLDPVAIWEELHKIPDKRLDAAKKSHDAEIAAAEQRGREAALSESAIPGQITAPGKHAPIFGSNRTSALQRPQPGTTTQAAVSALRSGKYRDAGRSKVPA